MSDFLEEYGLEMESDHFSAPMGRPTPPDPMLQPRKKGGALGKVLCLVLGFVLGVGGTVGGVAGAGYMVATQRIKDTIGTIGGLVGTEIKYQDFITEKYAEQTIMGAIGEISKVAQKFSTGDGCLNDLNDISPLVSTSIDPLLQTLTDFGMDINKEDLMALPFSQFPDFFMEAIKEIELIAILNAANVTDESPILNAICYDLDGNPTKLGIFFDEGPEGLLNNIPLEAFLISADGVVDPAKDNLIMALAYGNANRYSLTAENKVVMNQKIYKCIGGVFYDIDGNEVTVGTEEGKHTVTEEEITYYLSETKATKGRARADEVKIYYAYEDIACTQASYYKKITLGNLIGGNASDLINGLELGSLFNISPLDENPDPITLALAYGEEGTHYNIVNNQIVWIGNNKPKTIGDLLSGDITGLLDGIRLGTLLGISPLDENPDPITLALAYGEEGTHYVLKEVNGEKAIVWQVNPDAEEPGALYAPRTIGDLLEGDISALLDDIKLGTLLGVSPFDENPDPLTLALAYGEQGTHYVIKEVNGEQTIEWLNDEQGKPYQAKTVGDLLEGNVTELLNDIQLGQSLFKVSPLDAYKEVAPGETAKKPDAITLAIAYGEEGTHYILEDKDEDGTPDTIKWLNDKEGNPYKPKTVGDLLEGNFTDMMNDLKLGTLLSISPLDPYKEEPTTPDPIMLALAFGEVGTHYVLKEVDGEMTIEWLVNPDAETPGDTYGPRTMKDLTENANNIFNQMQLGTILGVKIDDLRNDPEADALTHAIAFGYEDTEFYFDNNGQVQWNIDPETDKPYGPRTVEDMKKMNKFMDSLRLATVLKVKIDDELTDSNRLTHALAFGYEGTHFEMVNGKPVWQVDPEAETPGTKYSYRTVGDMSKMGDIMDELRLATVLDVEIDAELTDSNRLTHALAFGYEGTHYKMVNGKPDWQVDPDATTPGTKYSYRTVGDMSKMGDIMDELRLATVLDIEIDAELTDSNRLTHALAFGYKDTDFTLDGEGNPTWKGDSYYRTVGDMSNMGDIMDTLRLATVLDVEIDELHTNPDADKLSHALAFGYEGTDFTLDGEGNPTWKGDSYYRTVKSMSKMGDIMNTLRVATVLDIEIDEELTDKNRLTHAIAFGYEGTDFTLDNEGNPTWIGDSYYRTVDSLSEMGPIMDTLRLATVLDVDPLDSEEDDKMTLAIAYGYKGTHYDIKEIDGEKTIVWREDPDADVPGTKYTYRTVKDMSNMGDIINDIRLETALGITADSPRLMVVLAYGSEGEGFEYVTDPATGDITGIEVKDGCTPRTIADLNDPDVINGLTLNDMLGAEALEDDLLLSHLGNSNLETLATDVSNLTFKQVYPEQIYNVKYFAVLGGVETELSSKDNKFYNGSTEILEEIVYAKYHYTMTKAPGDTVWTPANDWIKEDMIEYDSVSHYYRHKDTKVLLHFELTPQWKYLLMEKKDNETHDYKLTEFTKLVDNMTTNMTDATLFDLSQDGIIKLEDPNALNTDILDKINLGVTSITLPTYTDAQGNKITKLGQMTVTQMMDYTTKVISAINDLSKVNN